ncbi:organic cation transporter protein-like isoform X2 [Dermacentor albipictus]|uniref:organic cation transporter protein-like isoform X2 n=1 Tax=Dermacentor albipictus TaxID=60249 RepID=UPI0038FC214E
MAAASVDTVLDKLSRCHVVIFVFAFIRGLPVTWNLMMPVFVAPSAVEFRCADALNETVATSSDGGHEIWTNNTAQCFHSAGTNASEPCESWVYDRSVYGKTVTEEWNMVCSNRWMVSSSQSIYLAGMVVGTVAASHISDCHGDGVAALPLHADNDHGQWLDDGHAAVAVATLLDAGLACHPAIRSATTGAAVRARLVESPRWLMAMGRFPAAKQVVIKFARNAPAHVVDDIIDEAKRQKAAARDIGRASIADLFSTKVWARRTTLFSFQLIISSLVWYHMTVSTAGVGGNPYVNFAIGASSEYPVKLINVVLIKYFRRRFTICGTMCFSALVMVALWLLPREYSWLRLGLLMLGKVGTSVNGAVLRVQLSETYPTVVRSVAMGFCYTLGRLGSALAPFFDDLGEATQPWVPSVVSAGLCIAGAGASWLLPESFQKTLEDGFSNGEAAVNEAAATTTSSPKQVYVLEMTHF